MQKEEQKHTDDMNKENQRLNDSYNTSDNEKVREVKHKPYCRVAIFGEACECGEESKGWEGNLSLLTRFLFRQSIIHIKTCQ